MHKTIRSVFAAALAALLLLFSSCGNTPPSAGADTTLSPEVSDTEPSDTTALVTEPIVTEPIETEDPLKEQKSEIKQRVLALMAEDDKESPDTLFGKFCGDYSIGFVADHNDFGASVDRIWQKDGVTAIEYADGSIEYTLVRNGYQFKLLSKGNNTEVTSVAPVANADKYIPSIFADFGIDISAIYSGADEDSAEDPPLTEDMLTVSDDLSTCVFSEEYMRSVADMLLTELQYSEEDKTAFLSEYSGSGVYTAETDSVEFVIRGKERTLGDMTITVTYTQNDTDGVTMSTKTEYTVTAEGISVPTSNEIIFRNVKYEGDTPVSADIESRVLEQNAKIVSEGVEYTVDTANISRFYLDVNAPTLSVDISQESNTTVAGQTIPQFAHVSLTVSRRSLTYMASQNSTAYAEISGENVSFSAPEDAEIPQIVYDLADKAYYNMIG